MTAWDPRESVPQLSTSRTGHLVRFHQSSSEEFFTFTFLFLHISVYGEDKYVKVYLRGNSQNVGNSSLRNCRPPLNALNQLTISDVHFVLCFQICHFTFIFPFLINFYIFK